jgi:hypothetical protein
MSHARAKFLRRKRIFIPGALAAGKRLSRISTGFLPPVGADGFSSHYPTQKRLSGAIRA